MSCEGALTTAAPDAAEQTDCSIPAIAVDTKDYKQLGQKAFWEILELAPDSFVRIL